VNSSGNYRLLFIRTGNVIHGWRKTVIFRKAKGLASLIFLSDFCFLQASEYQSANQLGKIEKDISKEEREIK